MPLSFLPGIISVKYASKTMNTDDERLNIDMSVNRSIDPLFRYKFSLCSHFDAHKKESDMAGSQIP